MKPFRLILLIQILFIIASSCINNKVEQKNDTARVAEFDSLVNNIKSDDSIIVNHSSFFFEGNNVVFPNYNPDMVWSYFVLYQNKQEVNIYRIVFKMRDDIIRPDSCHAVFRSENSDNIKEDTLLFETAFINPLTEYIMKKGFLDKISISADVNDSFGLFLDGLNDSSIVDVYFPEFKSNTGDHGLDSIRNKYDNCLRITPNDLKHLLVNRKLYKTFRGI